MHAYRVNVVLHIRVRIGNGISVRGGSRVFSEDPQPSLLVFALSLLQRQFWWRPPLAALSDSLGASIIGILFPRHDPHLSMVMRRSGAGRWVLGAGRECARPNPS